MAFGGTESSRFTLFLIEGEIGSEKADIIVNSTNIGLDLSLGKVSSSLLKIAGPLLQEEIRAKYPNGIKYGDFARTGGYGLPCKEVFHVALPLGRSSECEKILLDTTRQCLEEASNAGYVSIVFPALGTGTLSYMPDVSARTMLEAISQFEDRPSSLEEVVIVICGNARTLKIFQQQFWIYPKKKASDITYQGAELPGVVIVNEDITKQKVDVIVRWKSRDLGLDQAEVSASLLKVCGVYQQAQTKKNSSQEFESHCISRTGCQGLACKEIFHITSFTNFSNGSIQVLRDATIQCLETASNSRHSSIAFSAFPTDTDDISPSKSACVMLNAINQFQKSTPNNSLWKIVIATCNSETFVAFTRELQRKSEPSPMKLLTGFLSRKPNKALSRGLPRSWIAHNQVETVKLVPLQSRENEYRRVVKSFFKTLGQKSVTVISVSRVQNPLLFKQYEAMKCTMTSQNGSFSEKHEVLLWHGSSASAISSINSKGFQRSYCSKNMVLLGQGVYFGVNSSYSTNSKYFPAEPHSGHLYVYQCRVLVGHSTQGYMNMRVLPSRAGAILFDSATDDELKPTFYVIFNVNQAYPEYLITFKQENSQEHLTRNEKGGVTGSLSNITEDI